MKSNKITTSTPIAPTDGLKDNVGIALQINIIQSDVQFTILHVFQLLHTKSIPHISQDPYNSMTCVKCNKGMKKFPSIVLREK